MVIKAIVCALFVLVMYTHMIFLPNIIKPLQHVIQFFLLFSQDLSSYRIRWRVCEAMFYVFSVSMKLFVSFYYYLPSSHYPSLVSLSTVVCFSISIPCEPDIAKHIRNRDSFGAVNTEKERYVIHMRASKWDNKHENSIAFSLKLH